MGPVEALKIALNKEEASIAMYRKFSLEHPEIKDLCLFLINEEEKHKKTISDKISQIMK